MKVKEVIHTINLHYAGKIEFAYVDRSSGQHVGTSSLCAKFTIDPLFKTEPPVPEIWFPLEARTIREAEKLFKDGFVDKSVYADLYCFIYKQNYWNEKLKDKDNNE